ncbi:MAG: MbcA/ParS/Xre antitoxin family protein [Gammaproteobacteria bacterium]|nr:MbcA/ParS/Xre antitoxin family protein [Gammaproteobacteria bacterium]
MMKNLSENEKGTLSRSIMTILERWGLNTEQQMTILDLPEKTPTRALRKYRDGQPFPDDNNVYRRLEHIIGIADALRTSYPHNPGMGALWMKQKSKHFRERVPLKIMVEDGLDGLMRVRSHLDCAFDWFDAK